MFGYVFVSKLYVQMLTDRIAVLEELNMGLIGKLLESKGLPAPVIVKEDKRTPEERIKDLAGADGVDLFADEDETPDQKRQREEDAEHEDELVEVQP